MDHRILQLSEAVLTRMDGTTYVVPVVPSCSVIYQHGEMFTAHGPRTAIPGSQVFTHPLRAILYPISKEPGTYRVWADTAVMAAIDPLKKGLTQTEWLAAGNRAKCTYWQVQGTKLDPISGKVVAVDTVVPVAAVPALDASPVKPWTVGDLTITSAKPTVPAVLRGYPEMKSEISAAAVQGPEP